MQKIVRSNLAGSHPPLAENDIAIEDQWMDTTFISDNKLLTRMGIENEIIESD
jgi:hypothetical protein